MRTLALRVAIVILLAILVWPQISHAIEVWSTDEEFTYGFLVVPIAIAITWWRRGALRRSIGRGHVGGLAITMAAIVLILISRRTGINALGGLAVTPLLIGATAYLWGWRAGRIVAFPSVFLVFGLGLYRGLLSSVGFGLQEITAKGAALAAQVMGVHVVRDGLVLHSGVGEPQFAFVVAQTCSGMSSLLSLLTLASLWVYVTKGSLPARAAVVAGVLPLVVLANSARVALVVFVGAQFGEDAALGFFHGASSLVLFGVALLGLVILSRIVGCKLAPLATAS